MVQSVWDMVPAVSTGEWSVFLFCTKKKKKTKPSKLSPNECFSNFKCVFKFDLICSRYRVVMAEEKSNRHCTAYCTVIITSLLKMSKQLYIIAKINSCSWKSSKVENECLICVSNHAGAYIWGKWAWEVRAFDVSEGLGTLESYQPNL